MGKLFAFINNSDVESRITSELLLYDSKETCEDYAIEEFDGEPSDSTGEHGVIYELTPVSLVKSAITIVPVKK